MGLNDAMVAIQVVESRTFQITPDTQNRMRRMDLTNWTKSLLITASGAEKNDHIIKKAAISNV